ncbi:MAG: ABC transporter permease [Candidatus Aminicenantes bacterium]|nr:ABC transporter permease [Candidatus Aminicenantes bacterium]
MARIREQGYSHWDGRLVERRRPWWPVLTMGIRLTFRKKNFRLLFAMSFIPAVVYLVGVYASERVEDFKFMVRGSSQLINIGPGFFKSYFTLDPLLFLMVMLMVFAGAGLIADDLKHNALQLYFARPLRKKDYLVGKAAVIAFFVLLLTLIPGLLLFIFKLIFAGSFALFRSYPWLPLSIVADALLLTVFFVCYTLLLSSLSRNRRYVMVMVFTVYVFTDIAFGILSDIFKSPYFALLSIKANLQQTGAVLFGQRPPHAFPAGLSFGVLLAFCLVASWVLQRRVRGVEVVK